MFSDSKVNGVRLVFLKTAGGDVQNNRRAQYKMRDM